MTTIDNCYYTLCLIEDTAIFTAHFSAPSQSRRDRTFPLVLALSARPDPASTLLSAYMRTTHEPATHLKCPIYSVVQENHNNRQVPSITR